MKLYLDTSLVVSLLTMEAASPRARHWAWEWRDSATFVISWWVETEFVSAISKKVRDKHIEPADRDSFLVAFNMQIAASAMMLPVVRAHFSAAREHCLHVNAGIRAADALHLAIAAESGSTLCTRDQKLAKAGLELGVATELI